MISTSFMTNDVGALPYEPICFVDVRLKRQLKCKSSPITVVEGFNEEYDVKKISKVLSKVSALETVCRLNACYLLNCSEFVKTTLIFIIFQKRSSHETWKPSETWDVSQNNSETIEITKIFSLSPWLFILYTFWTMII